MTVKVTQWRRRSVIAVSFPIPVSQNSEVIRTCPPTVISADGRSSAVHVQVPLLDICGRGSARMVMMLLFESVGRARVVCSCRISGGDA